MKRSVSPGDFSQRQLQPVGQILRRFQLGQLPAIQTILSQVARHIEKHARGNDKGGGIPIGDAIHNLRGVLAFGDALRPIPQPGQFRVTLLRLRLPPMTWRLCGADSCVLECVIRGRVVGSSERRIGIFCRAARVSGEQPPERRKQSPHENLKYFKVGEGSGRPNQTSANQRLSTGRRPTAFRATTGNWVRADLIPKPGQ